MKLKALFLNCTLKDPSQKSNTRAFIDQTIEIFNDLKVESEVIRITDFNIKFGTSLDEGSGDEFSKIYEKIKQCDIFIIATPIWRGDRSAIAKMISERMDGITKDGNDKNGQYPTYNKVAGVLVDGNEDGAKKAIASIVFDLSEHGFTIPVNAFSYYVGKAGPGPSYIEAGGDKHEFTNNMLLLMAHNLVHLATKLKENPYNTNVKNIAKKAKKMSE